MTATAPSSGARRADFLEGVRVLELGDGVAGAAATSILWSLGAEVTTVVDPASPHRRGRPAVMHGDAPVSLLSIILDRGKHVSTSFAGDPSPFDVVVVDRVVGARGALAAWSDIASYTAFVEQHNRGGWVTISAFGLTGERAHDVATELTVAAAGGMLSAVRDEHSGLPLKLAGQQSLLNTGQAAALAACDALDRAANGAPAHLDLAATEATLAMGTVLEVGGLLLATGSLGGAKRYGSPADFYACIDGLIRISAMEDHQWEGVVAAMGSPAWADQFATVQSRIDGAEHVDTHVEAWTRTQTKQHAETLLQSHGVPATAVYSPADLLDSPQLAHRAAFEALPVGEGRTTRVVGLPFRVVDGGNGAASGRRRSRSLRGLRVLEASRVLAVPLAGAILATLGAETTKLEDLPRLDMYRRRGPYIEGHAGPETSAYFALMNHSKGSAAFDVDAHRDRLAQLLGSADVVLENLGPKRAKALGLGAPFALAEHPDVLALSSSGFGQDGPHAAYRAYAYNLQASCALGYLTRNVGGESAEVDIAWADLISAYAIATIVAAWAVGPAGNAGAGVDFSMADLVVAHLNEFVAAASLDPQSDDAVDRANELAPYAPHGVYPTTDGWIAIAVDGDDQYAALRTVLGTERLRDASFATGADRFANRVMLDEHLAGATRGRVSRELAAELRAAGVSAERVLTADDLVAEPQLDGREFLTEVEHQAWGRRRLVGIPWRPAGEPALPLGAPPLLTPIDEHGEH